MAFEHLRTLLASEEGLNYDAAKATATALQVPNAGSNFFLNTVANGTTVTSLLSSLDPGRIIVLHNTDSDSITITNTAYASLASGLIFIGSGDYTLAQGYSIVLEQTANGWWRKLSAS